MKTPEQAAQGIFGERAAFYATSASHTDPQVLARVVELASPQAGDVALDVACGTGHTAFALAPHVAHVVGTDLTPQMLAEAKVLARRRAVVNVRFCLADVHAMPFESEAFGIVTCRRAAHHFSDVMRALQEVKRVLCRGGRLVIDDRSVPEDDFVDACMNELDRLHDESHVRQYRPTEWQAMLERSGFVVQSLGPYIKHRPLTSLTEGVSAENVCKIHSILDGLDGGQREKMNLAQVEGQLYLNHWYVMLLAQAR